MLPRTRPTLSDEEYQALLNVSGTISPLFSWLSSWLTRPGTGSTQSGSSGGPTSAGPRKQSGGVPRTTRSGSSTRRH
jgi:hypothetical protein